MTLEQIRNKLGDIRKFRKALKLNQVDFWTPVCVTQSGGSRYESGRDIPNQTLHLLNIIYIQKIPLHLIVRKNFKDGVLDNKTESDDEL